MRRKLVVGNWKMNGTLASNAALLADIKAGYSNLACDVAVCVPAPYFAQCQSLLLGTSIAFGGQDVSIHDTGAYTGEVAASMLQDFGCKYVIVGHSERRAYHAEGNDLVAQKAVKALKAGLVPIACLGETLEDREAGRITEVVGQQMSAILSVTAPEDMEKIVIAYEPVWAIGTGKTATPQMAQEVHAMIRSMLCAKNAELASRVQILYGGSMKPNNAKELMAMSDIDGGLVGGAALNATDFIAITQAA